MSKLKAIFWSKTVLPARGGDTIRPRWPLPIGVTISTTRMLTSSAEVSRISRRFGCSGVKSSNVVGETRSFGIEAVDQIDLHEGKIVLPFDRQTNRPLDDRPVFSPRRRIWLGET